MQIHFSSLNLLRNASALNAQICILLYKTSVLVHGAKTNMFLLLAPDVLINAD